MDYTVTVVFDRVLCVLDIEQSLVTYYECGKCNDNDNDKDIVITMSSLY